MSEKKYFNSTDARNLINTYGFALFPVMGFVDGKCMCRDPRCDSPGKHPANGDGFKSATKDIDKLKAAWAGRAGLNVGVATGAPSGIFVVDIDSASGEAALKELGTLPETLTVKTGKGRHLYFKYPGEKVITVRGVLPGVDIRGDGGYVCGVGTNHYSGAVYDWVNPLEDIADAPQFVLDIALASKQKRHNPEPLKIPKGKLNIYTDGWTEEKAYELLSFINPDCGYDQWISIGMAIHSEGMSFQLWDDWSRSGTKYNASSMKAHWKSFKSGGGVTFGTLVKMAKDGGWEPKAKSSDSFRMSTHPETQTQEESFDPETGEINEPHKKNKFFYVNAPDVVFDPDTQDFVQGTLTKGAMSVVYGESNCGKTFFMSDLAFNIVQGKPWNDKRVEKGNVLYICMEGAFGLKNRITAYRKEYGVNLNGFLMMPCAVDFTAENDGDIQELLELMAIAKAELGEISLIVVDTLARAIAGGDENSGQDMGELVRKADILRAHSGAHICFIHHSGKDKARGARGHSSLRAAVDTEIEISRAEGADYSSVKIAKQRDMERGDDLQFKLKMVELGQNRHGEKITSCVVEPYDFDGDLSERIHKKIKSGKTKTAHDALLECIHDKGRIRNNPNLPRVNVVMEEEFIEYLSKRGILSDNPKSAKIQYNRIRIDLIENDLLIFRDGYLWPKE